MGPHPPMQATALSLPLPVLFLTPAFPRFSLPGLTSPSAFPLQVLDSKRICEKSASSQQKNSEKSPKLSLAAASSRSLDGGSILQMSLVASVYNDVVFGALLQAPYSPPHSMQPACRNGLVGRGVRNCHKNRPC